jgi:hypothetical protein
LRELDHLFLFFFLIEKKKKKSLNKGVATNSIKSKQTEGANTDKKEKQEKRRKKGKKNKKRKI